MKIIIATAAAVKKNIFIPCDRHLLASLQLSFHFPFSFKLTAAKDIKPCPMESLSVDSIFHTSRRCADAAIPPTLGIKIPLWKSLCHFAKMLIPIALTWMLILTTRVSGSHCPGPNCPSWPCKGPEGGSICNWPDGVLKYQISPSFNRAEGDIIRRAVRHLEKKLKGCIRFVERKDGRRVYITNYGAGHPD